MPRRSDRLEFAEHFEGNPLEAYDPSEAYEQVRWGNPSQNEYVIDGPEPHLIELGYIARLELEHEVHHWDEADAPHLAVGLDTNRLYLLPRGADGPGDCNGPFEEVGEVYETHYTGLKGEDDAYWYHEHEAPYPTWYENPYTGASIIEPADYDGGPSYVVGPEGIIG